MADQRFAEDTVFVIFEGDYTLLQSDERARLEWEAAQDQIGLQLRATYELAAGFQNKKATSSKTGTFDGTKWTLATSSSTQASLGQSRDQAIE